MFAFKPLLFSCVVAATALAVNSCSQNSLQNRHSVNTNDLLFSLYLKAYNKEYCDDQEYQERQKLFEKSLKIINDLSKQHPNTKFGLNHMSDWSDVERQMLHGFRGGPLANEKMRYNLHTYVPQGNAPKSLDWREKGLVTEVKDQELCMSCYVFSAIGKLVFNYVFFYKFVMSLARHTLWFLL